MNIIQTSQSLQFRQAEVQQLFAWVRAGESASIIGVSGTGKSNLFNHLSDEKTRKHYLGPDNEHIIIVRINFHYAPSLTDRTIYSLILEQLELLNSNAKLWGLTSELVDHIGTQHEHLLNAGRDVLKVQRHFKLAVQAIMSQSSQRRLVLLMDQFDNVYQEAEPHIFLNLRGLREAYKYRIAYITFTRGLLPGLVEMDMAREEFYELMLPNVMGLGPYEPSDAQHLLQRISNRYHFPLDATLAKRLIRLCGGHAGIMRATYLAIARHEVTLPNDDETAIQILMQVPSIEMECEKLWRSLNGLERKTLTAYTNDLSIDPGHELSEWSLQIKGILHSEKPITIFAPLFAFFIQNQEADWNQPLFLDESARQVWITGKPKSVLSTIEFRLLRELYSRSGEVVTKDELIDAGWPDAQGAVSNEALHARISGIRKKIEPDPKNPRFLENIHGQGYKLVL